MPMYEYRCRQCQVVREVITSYSDNGDKPVQCQRCEAEMVREPIISRFSFRLKVAPKERTSGA